MRLWEFDRLGVVGSTPFDINKEGKAFVIVVLGCLWITEEKLGFDPTIVEGGGSYIHIRRNGQTERIWLEELMRRQRSVADRAMRCWRGSFWDGAGRELVIKDSWEYEERPEEGLLLKEATEADVKNVAQYYHYETVLTNDEVDDVLTNVRRGLSDTVGQNPLQQRRAAHSEAITSSRTSSSSGARRGRSRSSSRTMPRKRSSSSIQASISPPNGHARTCQLSRICTDEEIVFIIDLSCKILGRAFTNRVLHVAQWWDCLAA